MSQSFPQQPIIGVFMIKLMSNPIPKIQGITMFKVYITPPVGDPEVTVSIPVDHGVQKLEFIDHLHDKFALPGSQSPGGIPYHGPQGIYIFMGILVLYTFD
jgi:hypothetical protein